MQTAPKPSTPKRIIRGALIEGITFCPSSTSKEPLAMEQAKQHFNLSKTLRKKIVLQKVKAHELEEIWQAGIEEGYRKGLHEGQKQGYEAGKEEGIEEGFKEGADQIRAELKVAIELTNKIASNLLSKKEEIFNQLKPEIIKFSLAVSEKMLRKELSHAKSFLELLEKLFDEAKNIIKDTNVSIYLAPEDATMLEKEIHHLELDQEGFSNATFISDPMIPRGNCRIETPLGLINFDIERLLTDLEEKILGMKAE